MKTGDILLVSGKSDMAKAIQKFQSLEDKEAAKWNHAGGILVTNAGVYVVEASYIQQRKTKAAIVSTPIEHYMNGDYELLLLEHDRPDLCDLIEKQYHKYFGTPYGYSHLTYIQIIQKLTGRFLGRKENTDKRFICIEFVQTVWHNVTGWFPEHYKGNIKDVYRSEHFKHTKIK